MRFVRVLALVAVSVVASVSMANAQGVGSGAPDAQGGALGRDQPSSLDGKGVRRSAGKIPAMTAQPMMKKRHYRRHYRRHKMM